MVRDLTLGELLLWLEHVDKGIKAYKKEFKGEVRYNSFLFRFFTGWFSWARRAIRLVNYLPSSAVRDFVVKKLSENLIDTVIYTLSDQRSSYYEIRRKMLSGAVEELSEILNDEYYKQIIVAGHSMGSVIAYDALTRIALDISAPCGISKCRVSSTSATKIKGLVTFGSFLDLVAFLFKERTSDDNSVQRQILAHRLGFRSKHLADKLIVRSGVPEVRSPIGNDCLKEVEWLNFYHPKDYVVNQKLQAYNLQDENQHECKNRVESSFKAHDSYWSYDQMYMEIAERFFK